MAGGTRLNWIRIVVAIFLAEALPVLLLVAVVVAYSAVRQPESASPEEFAPRAGLWIGPIGGFLATWLFAWWAARTAAARKLAHGMVVGLGTALLDLGLGVLLGGADALQPIFFISNAGRIFAGVLGGWFAMRFSARFLTRLHRTTQTTRRRPEWRPNRGYSTWTVDPHTKIHG
jgi:hypothetical protein